MDVYEHRSGGIAFIRYMNSSFGEIPNQPGIDVTKSKFAAFGSLTDTGNILQDPGDLCTREIGVDHQARLFCNYRFHPLCSHFVTHRGGTTILPNDCVINRFTRFAVPHKRSLALVRDANPRDIAWLNLREAEGLRSDGDL